jgi:hypothetical protein
MFIPAFLRRRRSPRRFSRPGSSASDTLRPPAKDKLVELSVEIPKSLRKELRKKAEEQGMTLDALVTLYLRNR